MSEETAQALRDFMAARSLCAIATVTADSRPEAAYVAYTSNENHHLIVGTSSKSRKYQNLLQNQAAAVVIADTEGEVQYEGTVEVITPEQYQAAFTAGEFPKLPGFDKYRSDPSQVYLQITPTWIRFIIHGETDQITEITEFA